MVISRPRLSIIALCILALAGVAAWITLPDVLATTAPASLSTGGQANDEHRQQAKEFFGHRKEFDLTGGQEMRPRW